jgi:DNA polymerase-4
VTLKLKKGDFQLISRRHALTDPTQLTDRIYRAARDLFRAEVARGPFRLIGVGISDLAPEDQADLVGDLLDPDAAKRAKAERATDAIRAKFGREAIVKGRSLR